VLPGDGLWGVSVLWVGSLSCITLLMQSDWKTKATTPPAAALWGVLLRISGWEMNQGIFLPTLTLGALTTLFSREEEGSARGPLQLQMTHTGRDPSNEI